MTTLADLTLEKIEQLHPGEELNSLVAQALGYQVQPGLAIIDGKEVPQGPRIQKEFPGDPPVIARGPLPNYSRDDDRAMKAAEEFGLFEGRKIEKYAGQYCVVDTATDQFSKIGPDDYYPDDCSLAMTCCKAILFLAIQQR